MKKILWLFILLTPFWVFAYSKYIIPGGDTLGIEVNSKGVVVVGFYQVNGEYINKNLKVGDRILEVNDIEVSSSNNLIELIDKYKVNNKVNIEYIRNGNVYDTELVLGSDKGVYKTGLYVKGSVLGIGTLTYIDPNSKVYGILGHSLNMNKVNYKIEVRNGYSYFADVTGFIRSKDGSPGSKNADINKSQIFGTIENNTDYGVFGKIDKEITRELMEVGELEDIMLGTAYIRTTNELDDIKEYEIVILEIDKNNTERNIYFEIKDKELLKMSGGIVQGMSGSPIIQNNKIVGAVTRVLVDDVSKGFGISIVEMLNNGDKIA